MTPATYNRLVKLDRLTPFDLPREYQHIDFDCRMYVDQMTPLEFYAWLCGKLLVGDPIPILLDVPF